jgi:hypothetical protein
MRLLCLALVVLVPGAARADVKLEWMRAAHGRAMRHHDAGRWDRAAAELRAAYAHWPAAGVLFDEAVCRERKGDKRGAAALYQRYLAAAQSPPDRAAIERRVAALGLGLDGEPLAPEGVLVVESRPPGMAVYIDDRGAAPVGRTPWNGHLSGKHTVILAAEGYEDVYHAVDLEPRAITALDLEAPALPGAPLLEVTANVERARVYVGDRRRLAGHTPLSLPLTEGRHVVIVAKPGHADARHEVVVGRGARARLVATLAPRGTAAASAFVEAVAGASVVVDGKKVCLAPCLFEAHAGRRRVRVAKPGLGAWEQLVELESSAETGIELVPARPAWQATVTRRPID